MTPSLSNPVTLPAKKGHAATHVELVWTPADGQWRAHHVASGSVTKPYDSEENAIRAARRREWAK
jgi:hypothetical protein